MHTNSSFDTKRPNSAFTIVELLVVVAVIAIIAAIVIVAYNGITRNAVEVSLKSDLDSISSQLALDAKKGAYPADGTGLVVSEGNTLAYETKPYGYCAAVTNPKTPKSFAVKSSNLKIGEGECAASGDAYTNGGTSGFANGPCNSAKFSFNSATNGQGGGMAWDKSGNAYIADSGNHVIRKMTPDCTVSTYAGAVGVAGTVNGSLTAARFNYPASITIDSNDNLYVADRGSADGIIRKITPSGTVSTLTTEAPVGRSGEIVVYNNEIYVTRDGFGSSAITVPHSVSRVSLDGDVYPFVGSGAAGFANGSGAAAQFNMPTGIAVDRQGNLYVADNGNERIRKITQAGIVSTYAGTGARGATDGAALTTATFASPRSVAVDSAGWVYTRGTGYYAGTFNDTRVRVITPDGQVRPVYWSNSAQSGAQLTYGLSVDKDFNVWLLQSNGASGSNIYKISQ